MSKDNKHSVLSSNIRSFFSVLGIYQTLKRRTGYHYDKKSLSMLSCILPCNNSNNKTQEYYLAILKAILKAIDGCSPQSKSIIISRYIQQQSVMKIAKELRYSKTTYYKKQQQANKEFAENLYFESSKLNSISPINLIDINPKK